MNPAPNSGPAAEGIEQIQQDQVERDHMLLSIAAKYDTGECKNMNPLPKLAPLLCRAPTGLAPTPLSSMSSDQATHGRKLYYLWVRDVASYANTKKHTVQPVGQTLVKETWSVESKDDAALAAKFGVAESDSGPAIRNAQPMGKLMVRDQFERTHNRKDLFIMTKVAPNTVNTDMGWIYAVVSPDRKAVLDSGRIASCMACHSQTARDRLYGPHETWPLDDLGRPMEPVRGNE